ncbi:Somatomedin B domain [Trinorchestia longiramus]|nr:Somatomedin B domain [Trinorchestia longiramus]
MACRTNLCSVHGVLAISFVLLMPCVVAQKSLFFSNIPGDWCRTRSDPCCLDRQDDCSVPIFGTRCYCDEFCNRDDNPDCCPDYTPVCLGITPKPPPPLIVRNASKLLKSSYSNMPGAKDGLISFPLL